MADTNPPVPVAWEPEPADVHALPTDESPLQRIDRRVSNIQKGTEVSITMIKDHSAKDEQALTAIDKRLTAQDESAKQVAKTQAEHGLELKVQSRQLDTIIKVIAPRSGQTSTQLRAEIRQEIENSEAAHRRKRNLKILTVVGAIVVAALGAAGGIAAIISAAKS